MALQEREETVEEEDMEVVLDIVAEAAKKKQPVT